MDRQIIIPEKKSFGVAYARKLNLLFVLTRAGADIYDIRSTEKIADIKTINAPTDVVFDDENKYIYLLDSLGDLYKYDMQEVLRGNTEPICDIAAFELLNMCRALYYVKDDIVFGVGTTCDYVIDVETNTKDKVYDIDDDKQSKANTRYYDRESGVLTVVLEGNSFSVEEREFASGRLNVAFPIDVVTVKADEYSTTYLDGYQLIMEKKSAGILKKNMHLIIKGDDIEIRTSIDKKLRKILTQDLIYEHTVLNDRILVINTFKALVFIMLDENNPQIGVIDNVFGMFDKVEDNAVIFCVEKEGVVLFTDR